MAETTKHFRWIVFIKENLEMLTLGKDVFVAGDLLWYPLRGQVNICKAPDVMVVIGRPKGDRLSYLQWHEANMPPQVVFEIFSKSNRRRRNKEDLLEFYEQFGVEEYYTYDPDRNTFVIRVLHGNKFTALEGVPRWVSPLLGITFEWSEQGFKIFHPDGREFVGFEELERENQDLKKQYSEVMQLRAQERKRFLQVEIEARQARLEVETERQKVEAEKQRAEVEKQRAETEKQRAEAEKQRAEAAEQQFLASENQRKRLAEKLKELGIDPSKF